MKWNSAKSPPKEGMPVLVTYLGFCDGLPYADGVAFYRPAPDTEICGTWFWSLTEEEVDVTITHWAELPEPAKGGMS